MASLHAKKLTTNPIYERQNRESAQAFAAFAAYRDLGAERGVVKVGQKFGKSPRLMERWSALWSWVQRAAAWDAELDRRGLAAQVKARKEMVERHVKQAKGFQFKAIERLAAMKPEDLKAHDVLEFFVQGAKLERLSLGEPTDSLEQKTDPATTHALAEFNLLVKGATDEELEALRALFAGVVQRQQAANGPPDDSQRNGTASRIAFD